MGGDDLFLFVNDNENYPEFTNCVNDVLVSMHPTLETLYTL